MMINNIGLVIALFLTALALVVLASKTHMILIQTQARNKRYIERAQILSIQCSEEVVRLNRQSESFNRLFSEIEEVCINDPSMVCRQNCPHCKRGK